MENKFEKELTTKLFETADPSYRDFHAKLIPTVEKERIIGVRTPDLRKLAAQLVKSGDSEKVLALSLPQYYYDMMNLRAFVIEKKKDFDDALRLTEEFLPHIDNWATCDLFLPKVFKKYPERLFPYVKKWLGSDNTYTVRYGLVMLLNIYLKDCYDPVQLELAAQVRSDEYYIAMAQAWYFSMALVYRYDDALPYFEQRKLSEQVAKKAVQKYRESRLCDRQKHLYLKTLV